MSNPKEELVVWSEVPVTDMERAKQFYTTVLKVETNVDETGPNPITIMKRGEKEGVAGHLYPGKPAIDGSGPTIHFSAPDTLEDALARVEPAGGKVISPIITIPPGRFAYCMDPDGNSISLFGK